jgi:transcriptional regulator with XRE-family HTH domain
MPSSTEIENEIDEETLDWQQWVLNTIGELRRANTTSGILPWEQFANGLILCSEIVGSSKQLASLVGISKQLLSSWQNRKQMPSFGRMLELCYVLDISPLLLMTNNLEALKEALHAREIHRHPQPRHLSLHSVDREQALALIQAVLDGRVVPMGVRQLERRLGLGARTLIYHFPQECALVTTQYLAYRAEQAIQRIEQGCSEIRQTTLKLYTEGTHPSAQRVASMISEPGMMRTREGLSSWHATRRELGLET